MKQLDPLKKKQFFVGIILSINALQSILIENIEFVKNNTFWLKTATYM